MAATAAIYTLYINTHARNFSRKNDNIKSTFRFNHEIFFEPYFTTSVLSLVINDNHD